MKKSVSKIFLVIMLVLASPVQAVTTGNDGSAFITKAEFDSLKNNFQSQIDTYNTSIDSKIDAAIASYLAGITLDTNSKTFSNTSFFTYPLTLYGKRIIKTTDLDGKSITQVVGETPPANTHYEPLFGPDYVAFGHIAHGKQGENSYGYYYHKPVRYVNSFYNGTVNGSAVKVSGTYLPGSWTWTGFEIADSWGENGYVDSTGWIENTDGPMYWSMSLSYMPSTGHITAADTSPYEGDLTSKMITQFSVLKSTLDNKAQPVTGAIGYRPYSFHNYGKAVRQTDSAGVGGGSRNFYYGYSKGTTEPQSKTWSTNGYAYDTINSLSELDIFSVSGTPGTNNTTDYQVPVALDGKIYVTNFIDKINVHNNPTGRRDLQSRNVLSGYDLFQGFVDGGLDLESEMQSTSHVWSEKSLLQSARLVYDVKFDDGKTVTNNNMTHMIPILSLANIKSDVKDGTFFINIKLDIPSAAGTTKIAFANKSNNVQSIPTDIDANYLKIVKANGTIQSKATATCVNGDNTFYVNGLKKDDVLYFKLFWDYSNGATVSVNEKPYFEFAVES